MYGFHHTTLGKPDVSVELIQACSLTQASSLNHILNPHIYKALSILNKPDWTQSKILDVVGRYSLADKVYGIPGFLYIGVVCNEAKPIKARSHEKQRLINELCFIYRKIHIKYHI
jgi:hypothetical protein